MNKYIIIGILALFNISNAQKSDKLSSFGKINAGLHGIDFSYEYAISNKIVWENTIGAGMGSNVKGSTIEYFLVFNRPAAYFKSELKYIYNANKRISKNKKVTNNSGNYIGLQTKYSFGNSKTTTLNQTLLTEIHWGIQRSLGEKFIFNLHLGLGYIEDFDNEIGSISPAIGARFGYKLF